MPRFFVRIELPDRPEADYEDLHEKLQAKHYFREIETTSGRRHLQHATYTCDANNWTKDQIIAELYAIAKEVHDKPRVLVIESAGWTSQGLLKA
jgi:hypothetical protein